MSRLWQLPPAWTSEKDRVTAWSPPKLDTSGGDEKPSPVRSPLSRPMPPAATLTAGRTRGFAGSSPSCGAQVLREASEGHLCLPMCGLQHDTKVSLDRTLQVDEAINLDFTEMPWDSFPQPDGGPSPSEPQPPESRKSWGQSCLFVLKRETLGACETSRGPRRRGAGVFSSGETKEKLLSCSLATQCNEADCFGLSGDGVGSSGTLRSGTVLRYPCMVTASPPSRQRGAFLKRARSCRERCL